MDAFTVVIDGKECKAYPGETVLEVARRNGIEIPVFCYHRELRPEGACRLCLVEVEGASRLATACTLKAMPDMVVRTNTEKVKRMRAYVVELLLNNHTLECPVCDKAGECELQRVAYTYGPADMRYREPRREKDIVIKGPLIEIDNDRCILCRRCIRMCAENMGNRVLGIMQRGYKTYISPFNGDFLESGCKHCGSCVDVCPVGALLDRSFKFRDRSWRMTRTWTTCTICGSACRLEVDSYRSKVKRVVGRIGINTGHNGGYICVRGRWGWDILYSDKRLTTPLLAEGDSVKKITLSEAVAILKEKTERAKVNLYIESSLTTEELHLLGAVFGTENVTSDALSYSMALDGIAEITGERKTDPFSAIDEADTVFLIADFMEEINPVLMTLVKFAVVRGGKRLLRLGTYPSKLDRITSVLIKTSEEKVLDSLKHIIMSTFDSSYTSGSDAIDRASEIVRSGKVAFVLGGAFLFSPDVKELAKAVAYLAGRLRAKSHIVLVPPKANTLKVAELFPLKAPQELSGDVNVLVNTELYRDFPGVELKGSYTVLFTPYYTQDLAFADLIIPIETGLEKSGTVAGVNGNHRLSTALSPPFSLKGILQSLTFKGAPSTVKEKPSVNTELGDTSIRREKGKLLLTVVPNRTGWSSVSQYSENVSKVATSTVLYLNPQDAPEGSVVVLKTEFAELPLPFEVSRTVPTGSALLKVERFTRGISRLLKGCFPFLSGIQCEIEIGEA